MAEKSCWALVRRRLEPADLLAEILAGAQLHPGGLPPGVEVVRRRAGETTWLFVLNHTEAPVEVPATGLELVAARPVNVSLAVPPGGYAVVRQALLSK